MNKRAWLFIAVLVTSMIGEGWAEKRAHRPWGSSRSKSESTSLLTTRRGLNSVARRRSARIAAKQSGATRSTRVSSTRRRRTTVASRPVVEAVPSISAPSTERRLPIEKPAIESSSSSSDKGDAVAQQAMRYQGTRYVFGGKNNQKGFDCSGFVLRIFNDLKLGKLPHTSSAIYDYGRAVPLSDLRPGDLVFFKNTYKRGISHVGIYTGNSRFIHASNERRGVIVTSLAEPYYQLRYAGARRLY